MKTVFYAMASALILFAAPAMAQDDVEYYKEEQTIKIDTAQAGADQQLYKPGFPAMKNKMNLSLNAGTMFGSGFGGRGFSTYVAPELSYWVNDRFRLSTSLIMINSNYSFQGGEGGFSNMSSSAAILNVSGSYLVNERLMVSGSAFMDMNRLNNQNYNSQVNPYFATPNRGMSVNAEYKVTKNFSIGAGFSTTEGNGMYQPFGTGFGTGLHQNRLGQRGF